MRHKTLLVLLGLSIVLAAGASVVRADETTTKPPRPITGIFDLAVKAVLLTPPATDAVSAKPVVTRFAGRGRGLARPTVVSLRIGELMSTSNDKTVKLIFDRPLRRYGRRLSKFRGRGKVVVTIGGNEYSRRVRVNGRILKTETGAVMFGWFSARHRRGGRPRFAGSFRGPNIREPEEEVSDQP